MKTYITPKLEIQLTDCQDIVCGSRGVSVGNGGSDIKNWSWQLPKA